MKQSSIDWFVQEISTEMGYGKDLCKSDKKFYDEIIEEAKAMHKEEHRKTFNQGLMSNFQNFDDYYNETFNTKEK